MNVPIQSLIAILFAHWVGDYLFQGNTIAELKGKVLRWLVIHVLLYTATLIVFSLFLLPWRDAILFSLINGGLHFVTDFFTSRFSRKYKANLRIFYLIIGFDQFIHAVTLLITLYFYYGIL